METRILMTRRGCPYCLQMIKIINKINIKLPIDKKIRIIDCGNYEEFNLQNIPLIKKLEKDGLEHGYPFLFIDGIIIEPFPTVEQGIIFFKEFLKEEILFN